MIVLDQRDVVVLSDDQWLAFLEARAIGATDPAASYGYSVGEFSGKVAALLADESSLEDDDRDPCADLFIQDQDQLYAVGFADWTAFVAETRERTGAVVGDFGDVVGTVCVSADILSPEIAKSLAVAFRAAICIEADAEEAATEVPPLPSMRRRKKAS